MLSSRYAESAVRCFCDAATAYTTPSPANPSHCFTVAEIATGTGLCRSLAIEACFVLASEPEPVLLHIGGGDGCDLVFGLAVDRVSVG